ncbi:HAMP domain-containing protein [Duganella sp. FT92W]|uniref:HAMP domain-containing protein n=1 Tax=Pseudoduganella rivuli TaxID=2666085 RepID=A0A7X2IVE7_9BURK|nr:methyl-accepting chemotaxis protein [Pseudoduganella rivuli]MRV76749.1 HAMP domain-containing protein [Pseudoduganella rivuli]
MNFSNLKIGVRLGYAFALVVGLLVLIVAVAISRMNDAGVRMTNMLDDRYYKIELANGIRYNVAVIHQLMRDAVLAEDPDAVGRTADAMNALRAANKEKLARLDAVINVPKAREIFTAITAARAQDLAHQQALLKLLGAGQAAEARTLLNGDVQRAQQAYVKLLADFIDLQQSMMATEAVLVKEGFASGKLIMLGVAGAAILLTVAIAWRVAGSITRPLNEAVGMARRVADGDLSIRIDVTNTNETGQLMGALKDMNDSLVRIVSQVRHGAESIVAASTQIASGNMDLSGRTERQASALEETASSMEELTGAVQQNAGSARDGNRLAQSASDVAVRGKTVVSQVVDTMNAINQSSHKIVDIIAVIDGIAFQTNILALNAAVEAARAGEQGRGFAVVASEVRSLAQRSAAAAKEIKELIGNSVEQVGAGAQLVSAAGSTMDDVVDSVQQVAAIIGQISNASSEQSAGIEQVNNAIADMDDVTQQNAALVEQAAAAAQSLREQAENLSRLVGVFKLGAVTGPSGVMAAGGHRQLANAGKPALA